MDKNNFCNFDAGRRNKNGGIMWYVLLIFGMLAGIIGGMGMGGGTVLIPLLTIFASSFLPFGLVKLALAASKLASNSKLGLVVCKSLSACTTFSSSNFEFFDKCNIEA